MYLHVLYYPVPTETETTNSHRALGTMLSRSNTELWNLNLSWRYYRQENGVTTMQKKKKKKKKKTRSFR
ncbi:hypothetical protein BDA96_09G146500 [Sorghum bicolor]|uniref:Uncharacterized protein n=1 Tax=Sorghum bicolor TaxID=4558 RepID=A0A921Q9V3_SORBI|nr:hypothetical protein BDA96_09G146500 [Sorghum bicolor]